MRDPLFFFGSLRDAENQRLPPAGFPDSRIAKHRAEGRHSGAGGDEDRIADRFPEGKRSEGALHRDLSARFQCKEVRRKRTEVDTIQAKLEPVAVGSGGDGVRPGHPLALDFVGERNELPRAKVEVIDFWDFEGEVTNLWSDVLVFQ